MRKQALSEMPFPDASFDGLLACTRSIFFTDRAAPLREMQARAQAGRPPDHRYLEARADAPAAGAAVLCCDSHVLFMPGVIARLKRYYREHPHTGDLLQGPLLYEDGGLLSTHFDPVWRDQMWGV